MFGGFHIKVEIIFIEIILVYFFCFKCVLKECLLKILNAPGVN